MKKNIAVFILLMLAGITSSAQDGINKMDAKGLRHGLWKGTYPESKLPRYEGTFDHGKETGVFRFFEDAKASALMATRDFTAKDGSCYTIFFDPKGNKVSEGREVNKLYEGEWKFYHKESPVIMSTETYTKGKINGLRKVFYVNKATSEETTFVNGVKDGAYRKYTDDGILLEDAVYKNDNFHGPVTYKNVKGEIIVKGQFTEGKKSGIWKYYEGGRLVKEENKSAVRKSVRAKKVK